MSENQSLTENSASEQQTAIHQQMDNEIENDDKGAPSLILHDRALEQASRLGITSISISISHEEDYAFASCVMLSEECEI